MLHFFALVLLKGVFLLCLFFLKLLSQKTVVFTQSLLHNISNYFAPDDTGLADATLLSGASTAAALNTSLNTSLNTLADVEESFEMTRTNRWAVQPFFLKFFSIKNKNHLFWIGRS